MSAAEAVRPVVVAVGAHPFADAGIDRHAAAVGAVIDPAFLTEAGWDPARRVLVFASGASAAGTAGLPGRGLFDDRASGVADLRLVSSSACRTRAGRARDRFACATRSPTIGARTGRLWCRWLRAGMGVGAVGVVLGSCRAVARVARCQSRPVPDPPRETASAAGLLRGRRLHPATTPPRWTLLRCPPAAAAHRPHTRSRT